MICMILATKRVEIVTLEPKKAKVITNVVGRIHQLEEYMVVMALKKQGKILGLTNHKKI